MHTPSNINVTLHQALVLAPDGGLYMMDYDSISKYTDLQ